MSIGINKIKPHVYVKGSIEAAELYMEAFGLEKKENILDGDGNIWHCVLTRNDEEYISISEDKYLPNDLIKDYSKDIKPIMLFVDCIPRAFVTQ